jgi:hypothetical protein
MSNYITVRCIFVEKNNPVLRLVLAQIPANHFGKYVPPDVFTDKGKKFIFNGFKRNGLLYRELD